MKSKGFIIICVAMALTLSACSNSDSEIERMREENESLKAELSSIQTTVETTVKETENSTELVTEISSISESDITSVASTEVAEDNVESEYRPQMYMKYVRPCAEGIGTMHQSEVETLLSEVDNITNEENDLYYFYTFCDDTYEYTISILKQTKKIFLVAMSTKDYSFNVYIEEIDSKIAYKVDGEYGTDITKDFQEYVESLEESELFIFGDRSVYSEANSDNLDTISLAEYNQIELGMSYSDVIYIIGDPGKKISSSEIEGIYTSMYQFNGEGSIGANAVLMFQNGELCSKAQFGLE